MKIQLRLTNEDQSFPLTQNISYITALKKLGIEFVNDNQDFILIHASALNDNILKTKYPLVILERTDSTNIIKKAEIKIPHVLGMIKNTTLRPNELNNDTYCYGRYHNKLIQKLIPNKNDLLCNIPLTDPDPKLNEEDFKKIYNGYSFCHYDKLKYFHSLPINWESERINDIHFIGTTSYYSNLLSSYHRNLALHKIEQLKCHKIYGSNRMQSIKEYKLSLLNTKIVLSPWGHGEACYRDFEAIFCGCILLKPNSSFVNCWPDIYQNEITYISCKIDFSDLQEKVNFIKNNWKNLKEFRKKNLQILINSIKPEVFAKHMSKIFHECYNRL